MVEIAETIKNVMDNFVVFGLGLVGIYYTFTGIAELCPKPVKRKIKVSKTQKDNAA